MTAQPDLFRPELATHHTRQGRLFNTDGPALPGLGCAACGAEMERTPSGFIACPRGCGRLLGARPMTDPGVEDEPSLFD